MIVPSAARRGKVTIDPRRRGRTREEVRAIVARLVELAPGLLTTADQLPAPAPRREGRAAR